MVLLRYILHSNNLQQRVQLLALSRIQRGYIF